MLDPLDRHRRDSTLFQFTSRRLRDFVDPKHQGNRIYKEYKRGYRIEVSLEIGSELVENTHTAPMISISPLCKIPELTERSVTTSWTS